MKRLLLLITSMAVVSGGISAQEPMGFDHGSPVTTCYRPQMQTCGDTLFVSSPSGVFYRLLDAYDGWHQYAFSGISVTGFVRSGSTLLAASDGDHRLWRSDDGGLTCTPIDLDFHHDTHGPAVIVRSESHPDRLLLHNGGYEIWRSDDGGSSWTFLNDECGTLPPLLRIHPLHPDTVFIAGEWGSQEGFIARSEDGGLSWDWDGKFIVPGGDDSVNDVVFAPGCPRTMLFCSSFGRIGRSTDGGRTWQVVFGNELFWPLQKLAFDPAHPDVVYAAGGIWENGDDGHLLHIYKSDDGGLTWNLMECYGHESAAGPVCDMLVCGDRLILYTGSGNVMSFDKDNGKDLPTAYSIEEMKTMINPFVVLQLNNAVVTYIDPQGNAYLRDATAAVRWLGGALYSNIQKGNTLNGHIGGALTMAEDGAYEFAETDNGMSNLSIDPVPCNVDPSFISLWQTDNGLDRYISDYVAISGAVLDSIDGKLYIIDDNTDCSGTKTRRLHVIDRYDVCTSPVPSGSVCHDPISGILLRLDDEFILYPLDDIGSLTQWPPAPSGIRPVTATPAGTPEYDMSGRRTADCHRGLTIAAGRKYIVTSASRPGRGAR